MPTSLGARRLASRGVPENSQRLIASSVLTRSVRKFMVARRLRCISRNVGRHICRFRDRSRLPVEQVPYFGRHIYRFRDRSRLPVEQVPCFGRHICRFRDRSRLPVEQVPYFGRHMSPNLTIGWGRWGVTRERR